MNRLHTSWFTVCAQCNIQSSMDISGAITNHLYLQVQVLRATWTPSGPGMEGYMDTFRSRYGGLHGHLQVQEWRATWTPSGPGMKGYMDTRYGGLHNTFRSRYGGLCGYSSGNSLSLSLCDIPSFIIQLLIFNYHQHHNVHHTEVNITHNIDF